MQQLPCHSSETFKMICFEPTVFPTSRLCVTFINHSIRSAGSKQNHPQTTSNRGIPEQTHFWKIFRRVDQTRLGTAGFPWAGNFEGLSLEELLLLFMDPNEHHSRQPTKGKRRGLETQSPPSEYNPSGFPEGGERSFTSSFVRIKLLAVLQISPSHYCYWERQSVDSVVAKMWKNLN